MGRGERRGFLILHQTSRRTEKEGLCSPYLGPGLRTKFFRSLDSCHSGQKGTPAGRTHLLP